MSHRTTLSGADACQAFRHAIDSKSAPPRREHFALRERGPPEGLIVAKIGDSFHCHIAKLHRRRSIAREATSSSIRSAPQQVRGCTRWLRLTTGLTEFFGQSRTQSLPWPTIDLTACLLLSYWLCDVCTSHPSGSGRERCRACPWLPVHPQKASAPHRVQSSQALSARTDPWLRISRPSPFWVASRASVSIAGAQGLVSPWNTLAGKSGGARGARTKHVIRSDLWSDGACGQGRRAGLGMAFCGVLVTSQAPQLRPLAPQRAAGGAIRFCCSRPVASSASSHSPRISTTCFDHNSPPGNSDSTTSCRLLAS